MRFLWVSLILPLSLLAEPESSRRQKASDSTAHTFGRDIDSFLVDPSLSRLRPYLIPDYGAKLPQEAPQRVTKIRELLEEVEQVCENRGGPSAQRRHGELTTQKMDAQASYLQELFVKHGIKESEPPEDWDFKDPGSTELNKWKKNFGDASEVDRCMLFELAYSFAVWKVSTLEPTVPINNFGDILIDKVTQDIERDRRRAAWVFRYVRFLDPTKIPASCSSLSTEAQGRWDFIFSKRKPLGMAVGMCGRPMNAHYLDDAVSSHKRATPKGWSQDAKR